MGERVRERSLLGETGGRSTAADAKKWMELGIHKNKVSMNVSA